jgi:hypothetical protein
MRRRGRRCYQLLDDVEGKRSSWNLKDEALDHLLWRTAFGRVYGHFARQYVQQLAT